MERVYLDEATLLLLAAPRRAAGPWGQLCQDLITRERSRILTSHFALWQVCRYFTRHSNVVLLRNFLRDIESFADEISAASMAHLVAGLDLAEQYQLPYRHGVHTSIMRDLGIERLVSPDDRYAAVPGIRRIAT